MIRGLSTISPEAILTQLERIVASSTFRQSERMVRFLRFVVKHAVEQRQEPLKEYAIGVEAFDKAADFDPKADPIVRVEARRLRAKLRDYYADEGRADPLLIALPDRGYTPSFQWLHTPAPTVAIPVRRSKLVLAGLGVALLAAVVAWLVGYRGRDFSARKRTAIAVLPFADVSPNAENEYFSDGLTDEVINSLAAIEGLDVIARTSVFQFKGHGGDIRSIARQLNVQTVLEGSVRMEGDTVRVAAQLIDAVNGSQLWSQILERKITSVLEIQEDIARAIADRLKLGTTQTAARGATTNPEAYNFYLRGRHAWFHFTGPEARKSIEFFQQAVALDPEFAAAHAELAFGYVLATDSLALPSTELLPKARESARKAIDADPGYAEAHAAMGAVKIFLEWDWKGAEREFRRARELNPNSHRARFDYPVICLRAFGRFSEAASQLRRVLELDPVSPLANAFLGRALAEAGRYDEAIDHLKQATELNPNYAFTHATMGEAYMGKSMCTESLREYGRSRLLGADAPGILGNLGYVHARCGERNEARKLLEQLSNRTPPPEVDIARIYAGLGDKDRAFLHLQRAADLRYSQLVFLRGSTAMRELRSDPRFDRLLFETMGLPR
jgi:TolB-like protein/Flp pilus assembly protein TadD